MYRRFYVARKWIMVAALCMGPIYSSSCSMRDIRDAALEGGVNFVKGGVEDALGALFPINALLDALNGAESRLVDAL
jgi:hypothetical protein